MSAIWLAMVLAGLLTFLTRFSFIGLLRRWQAPPWVQRALRFVPPAVLSAIAVPEVLIPEGVLQPWNPRLLAAILAALVAWRARSAILAIVVGMATLLAAQAIWP